MNFIDHLAGFAVEVRGAGLGLFFELVVTFVGGSFVADRVSFFFVDGFFFEGAGSGEDWGLLIARTRGGNYFFGDGFFFLVFESDLLDDDCGLAGPSQGRRGRWVGETELLIPVRGSRGGLDWLRLTLYAIQEPSLFYLLLFNLFFFDVGFVDGANVLGSVVVLFVQGLGGGRIGISTSTSEDGFVFGEGRGYRRFRIRGRGFVEDLRGGLPRWRFGRGRLLGVALVLGDGL